MSSNQGTTQIRKRPGSIFSEKIQDKRVKTTSEPRPNVETLLPMMFKILEGFESSIQADPNSVWKIDLESMKSALIDSVNNTFDSIKEV